MPGPSRTYANNAERQRAYRARHRAAENALSAREAPTTVPPPAQFPAAPGPARWKSLARQTRAQVLLVIQEMRTYYDGHSERWQEGAVGERFQERLEEWEEVEQLLQALTH